MKLVAGTLSAGGAHLSVRIGAPGLHRDRHGSHHGHRRDACRRGDCVNHPPGCVQQIRHRRHVGVYDQSRDSDSSHRDQLHHYHRC